MCNSENELIKYRIKIENHLNPIAEKDLEIIKLMKEISMQRDEDEIKKLKRYFKIYFKVEWDRIKQEADSGEKEFTDEKFLEKWEEIDEKMN